LKYLKSYEIFFNKAETDFKSAKILYSSKDEDIDVEVVLFHLQQAIEKYLKAVLAYKNIHFSKTHDLKMLIDMDKDKIELNDNEIELMLELNQFAVNGRYNYIVEIVENIDDYFKIVLKIKENTYNLILI